MFDEATGAITLSSSDVSLIGSSLSLQVTCTSTNSEQEEKEAIDLFVVNFEDYCQFARLK